MKVKNEYVRLKIGNKEITKKNMILNLYLKYLIDAQLGTDGSKVNTDISRIGIRLDSSLDVNEDSELIMTASNFQLQFFNPKYTITKTPNTLQINYYADDSNGIIYDSQYKLLSELEELNGRKITGIAFGNTLRALTYLDTTEYDLTFDNRLILEVSRLDILTTDGLASSLEGDLDYPFHLAQRKSAEYDENGNQLFCQLYSVGFGMTPRLMNEEYPIGTYVTINRDDDYSYSFELENIGYPYIFYRYRFYYLEKDTLEPIYIDKYYYVSVKTEKNGIIKCISKIERG